MVRDMEGEPAVLATQGVAAQALTMPMMQPSAPADSSTPAQQTIYGLQIDDQCLAKCTRRTLNLTMVSFFLNSIYMFFVFLEGYTWWPMCQPDLGPGSKRCLSWQISAGQQSMIVGAALFLSLVIFICGWRAAQTNSTKPFCVFHVCQILAALIDIVQCVEFVVVVNGDPLAGRVGIVYICLAIIVLDLIFRCAASYWARQLSVEVKRDRSGTTAPQAVYGLRIADRRLANLTRRVLNLAVASVFLSLAYIIISDISWSNFWAEDAGGELMMTVSFLVSLALSGCGWRGAQTSSTKLFCVFCACQILAALLEAVQFSLILPVIDWSWFADLPLWDAVGSVHICLAILVLNLILRCAALQGGKQLFAEVKHSRVIHQAATKPSRPSPHSTREDAASATWEPEEQETRPEMPSEDSVVVRVEA